jgi:hypothetical protein
MSMPVQMEFGFEPVPTVPEKAKQGIEACAPEGWEWVEASEVNGTA